MANCKTMMYRRKSDESLPTGGESWVGARPENGGSGINYPPSQQHYHSQQYCTATTATKRYNRPLNNPADEMSPDARFVHNFQSGQGCHTGQLPRQQLPSFPSGPEHSVQSNYLQEYPAEPVPQKEYHEPPPRTWIQLAHSKHKRICVTALCYNILCSRYASSTLYSYCPHWALDWNYRRKAILQELVHYAPDIIALQEMETDQFYNFFLPQLQLLGYSGIFGAKSRARTMAESKRKLVDGCAIFYRTNKFRLLSEHLIEFSQVAIANATRCDRCSDEMLNRVQTKDNVALAALFEVKPDVEQTGSGHGFGTPRSRPLLVCTCHIHWDPNFCDVKLVQTMMLMQELKKITDRLQATRHPRQAEQPPTSRESDKPRGSSSSFPEEPAASRSGQSVSTLDDVNLLICGDFNSLPQSGVVQYIQSGTLSSFHPDFKGLSYEGYLGTVNVTRSCVCNVDAAGNKPAEPDPKQGSPRREEFQHDFQLSSVYPQDALPFTNYTLEFQGVIDYVFHSIRGLRPLGVLGPLDPAWLVQHNIVGAPHPCIPSDHLPLLVELEMIPVI